MAGQGVLAPRPFTRRPRHPHENEAKGALRKPGRSDHLEGEKEACTLEKLDERHVDADLGVVKSDAAQLLAPASDQAAQRVRTSATPFVITGAPAWFVVS